MILDRLKTFFDAEHALRCRDLDFTGAWMTVQTLRRALAEHPQAARIETVLSLQRVFDRPVYGRHKQSYFLFRETADGLADILRKSESDAVSQEAWTVLRNAALSRSGSVQRAAAEGLGSLPVGLEGPSLDVPPLEPAPQVPWPALTARRLRDFKVLGRSLAARCRRRQRLFVVKTAADKDEAALLQKEACWMEHLGRCLPTEDPAFDVPRPIRFQNRCVFRTEGVPLGNGRRARFAIAFSAHPDYFAYPNAPRNGAPLPPETFVEALSRNARALGSLAGRGILHTAPIPLFHNRVQQHRRNDGGRYLWPRGGRLDRWLASCRFPNFGLAGPRDFEHLEACRSRENDKLYQEMGSHLLSLFLVAGSYFRNCDPARIGWDEAGRPVDARDLFDPELLAQALETIVCGYFRGFVGTDCERPLPAADLPALASRMIEEMGVDRHMEEILRVPDQLEMTDQEFRSFLMERGYPPETVQKIQRGRDDVVVYTGPHLGAFNGRISLPELTRLVSAVTGLCISARHRKDHPTGRS